MCFVYFNIYIFRLIHRTFILRWMHSFRIWKFKKKLVLALLTMFWNYLLKTWYIIGNRLYKSFWPKCGLEYNAWYPTPQKTQILSQGALNWSQNVLLYHFKDRTSSFIYFPNISKIKNLLRNPSFLKMCSIKVLIYL